MWLRQSTASQEVLLGPFVDSSDGNTAETSLTIANTDIKIWVEGATTLADKNSGGATHISNGYYYAVLDATDTGTLGKMEINVKVAGALAVRREFMVLPAMVYDSLVLGTDRFDVNVTHVADTLQTAKDIGAAVPAAAAGASGGLLISGSNSGTTTLGALTITGATTHTGATVHTGNVSMAAGLTITQSTTDGDGLSITGNGIGKGANIIGGSGGGVGLGVEGVGSAPGAAISGGATGIGLRVNGGATSGIGVLISTVSGDGWKITSTDGHAINLAPSGSNTHGILATGGTGGTSDGIKAVAGTGGVPIRGDITGNITGNLSGTIGGLTAGALANLFDTDSGTTYASAVAGSVVKEIADNAGGTDLSVLRSGTCQSGSTTSYAVLDAGASATDDYYAGSVIAITGGTGAGQCNVIIDYTGSNKRAYPAALWKTAPDDTSTFAILATGPSDVYLWKNATPASLNGSYLDVNVYSISNDVTAANNMESFFDGTGYAGTNNVIPTVTTLTGHTPQTGDTYALANGANGFANIKSDTAAILVDTNELQTDWTNGGRLDLILDATALETTAQSILTDTAEIGAAGAGLTEAGGTGDQLTAIPWNAGWDAEVQSEVDDALVAQRLDELLNADSDIDGAAPPTVGSVFHELMTKTTGSFTYDQTTDSLEALRDRGDSAWITATGFSTHSAADVRSEMDSNSTQLAAIVADTNELQTDWVNGGRLDLILDARASQASVDTIDGNVDSILVDTAEIGAAGAGLTAIIGADGDTLKTLSDQIDGVAAGSSPQLLQNTTIATLATQTSFTLTAGSADNDAYNGGIAIFTDQSTSTQKAFIPISDYVGSTKTITLSASPAFTIAVGDIIDIVAAASDAPTAAAIRAEIDSNSTQLAAIVADTNELQTDWANGGRLDLLLDAVALESTAQAILTDTGTTLQGDITAILADTNELQTDWTNGGRLDLLLDATATQTSIDALNDLSAAQVNAEVDTALADYDGPTNTEMVAAFTQIKGATWSSSTDTLEAIRDRGDAAWVTATGFSTLDAAGVRTALGMASANLDTQLGDIPTVSEFNARTLPSASYFDPATDTVARVTLVDTVTANTDMRGTDNAALAATALSSATWTGTRAGYLDNLSGGAVALEATAQAILDDTGSSGVALSSAAISALLTQQMTESYAANGVAPTLAQAMFAVHQMLMQFAIAGVNYTVKKLDNSTTAFVVTLDDATSPTGAART